MAKVPNAVEILLKISTASVGHTSITDRQMIDGQATAYSERERYFTFAKNRSTFGEVVGKGMVVNFGSQCNIRH